MKKAVNIVLSSSVCFFMMGFQPVHSGHEQIEQGQTQSKLPTMAEQQLFELAKELNLPKQAMNPSFQAQIIQQLLIKTAQELGIPKSVALALGGYESRGWQMWSDIKHGDVVMNANRYTKGKIHSYDWGVMQINDRAHPGAFPRAAEDLKFNIQYGLAYLASLHSNAQGSFNLGFGKWDAALAAYNVGHRVNAYHPQGQKYVKRIRDFAFQNKLINEIPYTVQSGDTLGKIALNHWGKMSYWKKIVKANPSLQLSPRSLKPGLVIQLPITIHNEV